MRCINGGGHMSPRMPRDPRNSAKTGLRTHALYLLGSETAPHRCVGDCQAGVVREQPQPNKQEESTMNQVGTRPPGTLMINSTIAGTPDIALNPPPGLKKMPLMV